MLMTTCLSAIVMIVCYGINPILVGVVHRCVSVSHTASASGSICSTSYLHDHVHVHLTAPVIWLGTISQQICKRHESGITVVFAALSCSPTGRLVLESQWRKVSRQIRTAAPTCEQCSLPSCLYTHAMDAIRHGRLHHMMSTKSSTCCISRVESCSHECCEDHHCRVHVYALTSPC